MENPGRPRTPGGRISSILETRTKESDQHVWFREPAADDAIGMWQLAQHGLDLNSPYSYLMVAEHFASTSAVAVIGEALVGFVSGFRLPSDPSTLFIWQIAVSPDHGGRGIGSGLLDHVAERAVVPRLRFVEATITPSNVASARTFQRFARRRLTEYETSPLFESRHFPDAAHEAELRVRIGPF